MKNFLKNIFKSKPPNCSHNFGKHFVIEVYFKEGEEDRWIDFGDQEREVNSGQLKVRCENCRQIFLKKGLIFRNKESQEYCN